MVKRLVDVVLGSILGLLALPLVLMLAIVSAALFRAWPFFVQQRVGRGGVAFRILKIRTLPRCAPTEADKFSLREIPLPRFASILRNTHLDELPQLWLVPFGAMSLVGPRPEMRFLHDQADQDFARLRVSVRPGCTGLWQVSRAAAGLIWQGSDYDRFYLENACLRLDLWILARTFGVMTRSARVIALDEVPPWVLARSQKTDDWIAPATNVLIAGASGVEVGPDVAAEP